MKKTIFILGLAHVLVSLASAIVHLAIQIYEFVALIANYRPFRIDEKLYSPI